jgi:hypothetical protein
MLIDGLVVRTICVDRRTRLRINAPLRRVKRQATEPCSSATSTIALGEIASRCALLFSVAAEIVLRVFLAPRRTDLPGRQVDFVRP